MRRKLLVSVLAAMVAAIAIAAVSVAGSGGDRPASASASERGGHGLAAKRDRKGLAGGRHRGGHRGHRGHRAMHRMVLRSLAERLDVTPRELRAALRATRTRTLERAVERGAITAGQRDVLAACLRSRATCDRSAARPAFRALKAEARTTDFAARKRELASDLAAELGKEPGAVVAAVRAELERKLGWAVTFGAITERGRDLALGCFDDPNACDVAALRGEMRMGRHGRRGHG